MRCGIMIIIMDYDTMGRKVLFDGCSECFFRVG
jgi:hypothetical protein